MKMYQPARKEKPGILQGGPNQSATVQSKSYSAGTGYSASPFQRKADVSMENTREDLTEPQTVTTQPKEYAARTNYAQPPVQLKANQTGLPDKLKGGLEALSGYSLDDVRVHYNSDRPARLQALAYTQGTDIHVAPGQEMHLPHEAWHAVQQKQGRVQATMQMKEGVPVNDDTGLEQEADLMGAKALNSVPSASQQTQLKESTVEAASNAPVQGRFGFEIELPMLFLHKDNYDIPSLAGGADITMNDVPVDAGMRAGETDVHDGPECHVNVDHSKTLNPLFEADLRQYAVANGLNGNATDSLLAVKGHFMPHAASIVEVVTDAWDESTLSRTQALQKIRAVIAWIRARYDEIAGNQQAAMGDYFIGSDSPQSDHFQPRLGYFHSTYGVKLSQVPRMLQETTRQKNNLRDYAARNAPEQEHARNVMQTFNSIGAAKRALREIKAAWPRVGGGRFKKGTKGWNNGTEQAFLGFITLLSNYLLMFKSGNGANLAKQMVGMHYYKSDLYDVAQQLPNEVINTLQGNAGLLASTITAIGNATGFGAGDDLGGPMGGYTLTEYLEQIFTGNLGIIKTQNTDDLRDPLLAGSINPYSRKLGPDMLGPAGNQERGVVMENRHLEYLDRNYGRNQDASERQMREDVINYGRPAGVDDPRTADQKAIFDSIGAREAGPARRPIGEWERIMIGIYDMVRRINRRRP